MGARNISAEPVSRDEAIMWENISAQEEGQVVGKTRSVSWALFLEVHIFCAPAVCQALCQMLMKDD